MTTAQIITDDLLEPISVDQPAGVDLRWTPDWDRIKEARRADDELDPGRWAKKERKSANWPQVKGLAESILREKSKDLQIALWLTEANINLHGFPGLRDSLRLIRELMVSYWDRGLYPPIEDGPEDRMGPLEWLNDKLIDSVLALPITERADGGADYSLIDLQDARRVGSEAGCHTPDGDIDPGKKREYDAALEAGRISMEMFDRAVRETKRASYEAFQTVFAEAYEQFRLFEKTVEDKFGETGPNLSACRSAFASLDLEISEILARKRRDEPDTVESSDPSAKTAVASAAGSSPGERGVVRVPLAWGGSSSPGDRSSWEQAEMLIKAGQVDQGLAEMTRLAARETTGRDRFQRRLLLADICLTSKRERLARSILEELSAQIDKHQLEQWESTELIAAAWTRLHQVYRRNEADADRAAALYERLCKLDPWQALKCTEE